MSNGGAPSMGFAFFFAGSIRTNHRPYSMNAQKSNIHITYESNHQARKKAIQAGLLRLFN